MRRVRFRDPDGEVRSGEWTGEEGAEIRAYPSDGGRFSVEPEFFAASGVELLAPCDPSKVVCVGLNYADHADEQGKEVPDRPLLFLKPPNAVAAPDSTVELPAGVERLDFEAELGVVIGERCRHVDASDAERVVAGYTCVNDLSNRDDQAVETNWVRGKAFDDAAPIGPAVASELVEEITTHMTLEPGDVISTGTPEGVGPLSDGDTVEVTVEGVGTLTNDVHIP
ncbi:2-hydroxyhepta-2,4-diene-1,7-dioate isomerase [Halobacteriales archaeon SW_5_68_122]|nr:MAG: 2-hydroxyhepta-2,4-diene-1,7-dioate isomerase [Halobacteriales archaeon SW_5_68_122]